jgi:hypothetical protein
MVCPRAPDAGRLLIQTRSPPTSSTSFCETIERGATSVTSMRSFAHSSRCFSSSHSFPFGERPWMRTSAHSPNIFFPYRRNVSLPLFNAFTGSSPGSMNSHSPLSHTITFPAP